MLTWLPLWENWGFAASLYGQAKYFLTSAKRSAVNEQEGLIRASIVFFLMSLEAYFFAEIIKEYLQKNDATLDPVKVKKIQDGLLKHTGFRKAIQTWPTVLTGRPLIQTSAYSNFVRFVEYRNCLLHGKITERIPSWRKLAQEVETINNCELAQKTVSEMVTMTAQHFGFDVPTWV